MSVVDQSMRSCRGKEKINIPTEFSSMIFWALTLAADMSTSDVEVKNRRRNEMVGNLGVLFVGEVKGLVEGRGG